MSDTETAKAFGRNAYDARVKAAQLTHKTLTAKVSDAEDAYWAIDAWIERHRSADVDVSALEEVRHILWRQLGGEDFHS